MPKDKSGLYRGRMPEQSRTAYPHMQGDVLMSVLDNMLTPQGVDSTGDLLAPPNDAAHGTGMIGKATTADNDPAGYLTPFGDGTED